jgi:hypothetical protein
MKKLAALSTTVAYLLTAASALAQGPTRNTNITFGGVGVDPSQRSLGDVVSNAVLIVFIVAGMAVLVYLIIGAFKWITSGGDKDAIGKARGTIVNALIGLAILALAFFITVLFGQILNINILNFGVLPTLNDPPKQLSN